MFQNEICIFVGLVLSKHHLPNDTDSIGFWKFRRDPNHAQHPLRLSTYQFQDVFPLADMKVANLVTGTFSNIFIYVPTSIIQFVLRPRSLTYALHNIMYTLIKMEFRIALRLKTCDSICLPYSFKNNSGFFSV